MAPNEDVLAAYSAKRCPIRVHWDTHEQFRLPHEPDPVSQRQIDLGRRFETVVFGEITRRIPDDVVDLRSDAAGADPAAPASRTLEAMDAGALVIIEATLPTVNGRSGRPDLLVRVDNPDGTVAGYIPVDVKAHKHLGDTSKSADETMRARISLLRDPSPTPARHHPTRLTRAPGDRFEDVLQLAHYTRMLQDLGRHPGDDWLWGGVIGTSQLAELGHDHDEALTIAWHKLDEEQHQSFSKSESTNKKKRSALDRYDHEFGFRHKVARRPDANVDPNLSLDQLQADLDIQPFRIEECEGCPYSQAHCEPALDGHASSHVVQDRLGVRTWGSLARHGIRTTSELCGLDVQAFLQDARRNSWNVDYLDTEKKLQNARRRAQLVDANKLWEWVHELKIPSAPVEIDVDFEYDSATGACYLITARRREGQDDSTRTIKVWDDFDTATRERGDVLVRQFLSWAAEEVHRAEDRHGVGGDAIRFYHWKGPERWMVKRASEGSPDLDDAWDAYQTHLVDMGSLLMKALFSVKGTSVKLVGPAYGFSWTDSEAGGGNSLAKLDEARSEDPSEREAARAWLIKYNEDDVDVMAYLRDAVAARPDHVPKYDSVTGIVLEDDE